MTTWIFTRSTLSVPASRYRTEFALTILCDARLTTKQQELDPVSEIVVGFDT